MVPGSRGVAIEIGRKDPFIRESAGAAEVFGDCGRLAST
jgi:hypothetical protein